MMKEMMKGNMEGMLKGVTHENPTKINLIRTIFHLLFCLVVAIYSFVLPSLSR